MLRWARPQARTTNFAGTPNCDGAEGPLSGQLPPYVVAADLPVSRQWSRLRRITRTAIKASAPARESGDKHAQPIAAENLRLTRTTDLTIIGSHV